MSVRIFLLIVCVLSTAVSACGDDDRSSGGGNAAAGRGDGGSGKEGAAGSGASGVTAGSSGQGGRSAASGAPGSGGASRAGTGAAGSAGAAGAAGAAGRAGSAGTAGAAGRGDVGGDSSDDDAGAAGSSSEVQSGEFTALTYNVAGLPEGFSSSMPLTYTPLIAPRLNDYDLVFLQESWQTPDPNPVFPLRVYHEILVAGSTHAYKTVPAEQPLGNDPSRPSALLGDGLNIFSEYPLGETTRVAWSICVDTESDCLAFKGFSMTPAQFVDGAPVHLYDLHMEAGSSVEDDMARDMGIDQLLAFLEATSQGQAVIIGGDFNLETDAEPAKSQLARLLQSGGLRDACAELACPSPGNIDRILYRSSDRVTFAAKAWHLEAEVFVSPDGKVLSDHAPLAVRIAYQVKSE